MSHDPSGNLTGWDLSGFHEGHDTEAWRRLGALETTVHDDERDPSRRPPQGTAPKIESRVGTIGPYRMSAPI